ncbi:MAG: SAM-dependent methyltransferase [Pseudomonadota bacterium]
MPGYDTKQESIAVTGVADLLIRSLLDRQQFHDPLGAAERLGISSAAWPLFGLNWPSGARLAAHLALRPVQAGEHILEIGCGLALASLVGHRRGADITASDCHPLAGSFLDANLLLNALGPMKYRHGHWGAGQHAATTEGDAPRRDVQGVFELIIGSDILYERDTNAHLAGFISAHATPVAEVWIVDPDRGNRAAFTRQMVALGFRASEERLDQAATASAMAYKGRLLTYRRGDTA